MIEKTAKQHTAFSLQQRATPLIISGPCSAETEEQLTNTAKQLAATGIVHLLRAGIWKPRTRPGSFEGVGTVGLQWLQTAKQETGLPTTVEVANAKHVEQALAHGIDVLWIGARTSVNPFAVQTIADAVKGVNITVLIKNPINPDLNLWIGAIERIKNAGISEVGAIHRGFSRYGEQTYRNAPNWQIPIELMRKFPNLPMICDPSHICGRRNLLKKVAQKALDLSFDGLMLETHIDPDNAWSDARQQITPKQFLQLYKELAFRNPIAEELEADPLEEARLQIDQLDEEIITLLAKRMDIATAIGKIKKLHHLRIYQPERWEVINQRMLEQGKKAGLSQPFIEHYLKAIHAESIEKQMEVMNNGTTQR